MHWPAVRALPSRDHDGPQSRPAHDKSFSDELLDGAGGSLIADAILGAEFDGPRQLVPGGALIGGLVVAGEDRRAEGIGDLPVGSLPREGQEVVSRDVEPSV
jgi:hypothetical protein